MGVHDLWKLLRPCGTLLDLSTLQGKVLAIDASIWLTQFLKAMRDAETGQMLDYAHLVGTIRRVCKLMYYRIKPVFVFDGGVPLLKLQTMRNRRNKSIMDENRRQAALRKMLASQMMINGLTTASASSSSSSNTKQQQKKKRTTTKKERQRAAMLEEEEEEEEELVGYRRRTYYKLGEFQATTTLGHNEFSHVQLTQFLLDARKKKQEKDAKISRAAAANASSSSSSERKPLRGDDTREYSLVLDNDAINGERSSTATTFKRPKMASAASPVVVDLAKDDEEDEDDDEDDEDEDDEDEYVAFADAVDGVEGECLAALDELLHGAGMTRSALLSLLWGAAFPPAGMAKEEDKDDDTAVGQLKRAFMGHITQLLADYGNSHAEHAVLMNKASLVTHGSSGGGSSGVSPDDDNEGSELSFDMGQEEDASGVTTTTTPNVDTPPPPPPQEQEEDEDEEELAFEQEEEVREEEEEVYEDDDDDVVMEEEEDERWRWEAVPSSLVVLEEEEEPAAAAAADEEEIEFVPAPPEQQDVAAAAAAEDISPSPAHRRDAPQQFAPPASFLQAANATQETKQAITALEQAKQALQSQVNRAARDADTVTPEMRLEVMALLDLFGLPYVEAPMEAEAQCAALELAGLVDGVVTEDSDVFLFGATRVYKNIFAASDGGGNSGSRHTAASAYYAEDIAEQFSLGREELISLALLLGSDYTEGVHGIGIVNALEVIQAFANLEEFKLWMDTGELAAEEDEATTKFKLSHVNARARWAHGLPRTEFPDQSVRDAYQHPHVTMPPPNLVGGGVGAGGRFEFRQPDLAALRVLCVDKLRMPLERVEKLVIEPLVRPSHQPTQTTLDGFVEIKGKQRFAAIRSKRMAKAVSGMMQRQSAATELALGDVAEAVSVLAVDELGQVVSLAKRSGEEEEEE